MKVSVRSFTVIAGLTATLLLLGYPTVAKAVDSTEEITLSPTDKHYQVKPSEVLNDTFTIVNSGTTDFDFVVYTAPFSVKDGTYETNFTPEGSQPSADAYTWVQLPQVRYHLAAGQSVRVPYIMRVKADASPGGHYGVIFAETQPPEGAGTGNIARKKRLALLLYATVEGKVVIDGKLKSITTDTFQNKAPLSTIVALENSGNTDYKVETHWLVTDLFGSKKYEQSGENYMLPKTNRQLTLTWDSTPWFGLFKVHTDVVMLGKTTSSDAYVLVAPQWLYFLIVVALVLALLDVLRRRKRAPKQLRRHR